MFSHTCTDTHFYQLIEFPRTVKSMMMDPFHGFKLSHDGLPHTHAVHHKDPHDPKSALVTASPSWTVCPRRRFGHGSVISSSAPPCASSPS
eukprot:gene1441-11765_t